MRSIYATYFRQLIMFWVSRSAYVRSSIVNSNSYGAIFRHGLKLHYQPISSVSSPSVLVVKRESEITRRLQAFLFEFKYIYQFKNSNA